MIYNYWKLLREDLHNNTDSILHINIYITEWW